MAIISGGIFQLTVVVGFLVIIYIIHRIIKSSGELPQIRGIAAMDALDEAVGRAAETGRPLHFTEGIRARVESGYHVQLAAYSVMSYLAKECAKKGARFVTVSGAEASMPLILELCHQAAVTEGKPEMYVQEDHYYFPEESMSAGVVSVMEREKIASNVMIGQLTHEGMIFVETAAELGAYQIGGLPTGTVGMSGMWACACDYLLIAEEAYIAGAYLSKNISQFGTIAGTDVCSWIFLFLIVLGGVAVSAGFAFPWY